MTRSFRVMEYLEDFDVKYAIILQKWDDRIKEDSEYRCFIFDRKCEAVSRIIDCSEPTKEVKDRLEDYIKNNVEFFPDNDVALDVCVLNSGEIIFIEFNPVNDELDTYGIMDRDVHLTKYAYQKLQQGAKI